MSLCISASGLISPGGSCFLPRERAGGAESSWSRALPSSKGKQFAGAKKWRVIHAPRAPRSVDGRGAGARRGRMSLACRTSFPVSPGKSIQRPRHDVQHPHRAPERSTVITILHVTLSAHPTNEKKRRQRWRRRRRRRTRRMRTLTTLQYTGGHGVYKPPQFYLRPF